MKMIKFESKRQQMQFNRSRKLVQELIHQRSQVKKSQFDLQNIFLQEATKKNPKIEDATPLPRSIHAALNKYQATRRKDTFKRPLRSFSSFAEAKMDMGDVFEAMHEHLARPKPISLTIAQSDFNLIFTEGCAEAYQIDTQKKAYGSVGDASLVGPTACAWNYSAFGFVSCFNLTGTGKDLSVDISTKLSVYYLWLEALSFGKKAWGEVVANSYVDVDVEGLRFSDSLELIRGESPRGNYEEGEIGVWNPSPFRDSKNHRIVFSVNFPKNTEHLVTLWETIELYAIRHHRTDRCNAVADLSCFFDPVEVEIFSPWW